MPYPKTWYLVADGAQARIVRSGNADPSSQDNLEDIVLTGEHKDLSEIMADRPGRSFSSHDQRRSAMEYHSDPALDQQKRFAGIISGHLERHYAEGGFDQLVIVAAPRMLGIIRDTLPVSLQSAVTGEIAKDLTNLPQNKLRAALAGLDVPAARQKL